MMTFEDIQRANEQIRTTDIKGKDYAEVNQRIKAFRMVYPDGFIHTHMKSNENGVCVFKAKCGFFDENGMMQVIATGTAYEKEDSSFINKTSYIENCETSAVGRALGMAGFGIDTSVCSAEELGNALTQQESNESITEAHVRKINALAKEKGSNVEDICKYFNVESLNEMTVKDYGKCLVMLNAKKGKNDETTS